MLLRALTTLIKEQINYLKVLIKQRRKKEKKLLMLIRALLFKVIGTQEKYYQQITALKKQVFMKKIVFRQKKSQYLRTIRITILVRQIIASKAIAITLNSIALFR